MYTANQVQESLIGALNNVRIPLQNHDFIQRLTTAVGIDQYRSVVRSDKSRVIATRRGGGPDLRLYYGYRAITET